MKSRDIIEEFSFNNMTVTKRQRDSILSNYPILAKHDNFQRFFIWLAKGHHFLDKDTGYIVVPHKIIWRCCAGRRVNTEGFLEEYKQRVSSAFEYTERYSHSKKKARMIKNTGIDELFLSSENEDEYYVTTMKKRTDRSRTEQVRILKKTLLTTEYPYEDQKVIADYLHRLPLLINKTFIAENFEEAYRLAGAQQAALERIRDEVFTYYLPSSHINESLCPRLFGSGIALLKKDVRKALMKGTIDIDLKNAHLAYFASKNKEIMPSTWGVIAEGMSSWGPLLEHMGAGMEAKGVVKQMTYSLAYGMSVGRAKRSAIHGWWGGRAGLKEQVGEEEARRMVGALFSHPIISELARAVQTMKDTIQERGGIETAYGWQELGARQANTLLSVAAQSYEMAIIRAVYDLAIAEKKNRHKTFDIVLHQHDGVTIQIAPDVDKSKVLERITSAVKTRGEEKGITVSIDAS